MRTHKENDENNTKLEQINSRQMDNNMPLMMRQQE